MSHFHDDFDASTAVLEWDIVNDEVCPLIKNKEDGRVMARPAWAPMPGSQSAFLECPVFEVLYEGNRGPGKTDALIMDFAQHVGQGWGVEWKGILFRRTYKQLKDVIAKTKKWFPRIFPSATFNETDKEWKWPTGEVLTLSYMERESDYDNYHGGAWPWMAFEELTTWADDKCYRVMMSCCRSTKKGMPRKLRATTNPYGVGHNWVKKRFKLPTRNGYVGTFILGEGKTHEEQMDNARISIRGQLHENIVMMHADPGYENKIRQAARNPSELAAWLEGSWDVTAGGMFDDIWKNDVHVVDMFPIPASWKVDRSFDWGSSKPFSVGWWAESDGSTVVCKDGRVIHTVPGDLFRVAEWYGCQHIDGIPVDNEGVKATAKQIAAGIIAREKRLFPTRSVRPGPADSSIFTTENDNSVGTDMENEGVFWERADKRPGSRKNGWDRMRAMLKNALPCEEGPREEPGLFIFEHCEHFIRTVPSIPRSDKDLDDVNTDAEDHIADETRYRCYQRAHDVGITPIRGR